MIIEIIGDGTLWRAGETTSLGMFSEAATEAPSSQHGADVA
mgnify:CR=1 FL=1